MISYVLPVYNKESTIAVCIRSLIAQKGKKEIIVINDGSKDHTKEILATFPSIIVVTHEQPTGAMHCRNAGNMLARGAIIAVCNVDIQLPDRGKAIKAFFKENKDTEIFYSSAYVVSKEGRYTAPSEPIIHGTVAYRKIVWDKGVYQIGEGDDGFLDRACRNGFSSGGTDTPLIIMEENND
jgi:glycosyltransferase involved in cell wall biosynthesis